MLNHLIARRDFLRASVLIPLTIVGCRKKTDLSSPEFGEVIDHLPIVEDLPRSFPISEKVDEGEECPLRENCEKGARRTLLKSQGREEELKAEGFDI